MLSSVKIMLTQNKTDGNFLGETTRKHKTHCLNIMPLYNRVICLLQNSLVPTFTQPVQ